MPRPIKKTSPVVKMTLKKRSGMSFSTTGIIPYLVMLSILAGLFGPVGKASAAEEGLGRCTVTILGAPYPIEKGQMTKTACDAQIKKADGTIDRTMSATWVPSEAAAAAGATATTVTGVRVIDTGSAFENNISECRALTGGLDACLVKLAYYIFYVVPSFLLNLVANFFNIIIPLALSSTMYTASFIGDAWTIVRDLSNIFFILILLYIAIKTILGLGGSEVKKMIVQVIIMALLINFSMFFTKIIIDSSNILALVFYNKIDVKTIDKEGKISKRIYVPMLKSGVEDKDMTGSLVYKFDPTKLLTQEFFTKVKERSSVVPTALGVGASIGSGALIGSFIPIVGTGIGAIIGGIAYGLSFVKGAEVPPGIMLGIILSAGLIMIFAIYAFFIASISFVGRLIELWVLIIFSPFAFMSSTIPLLSGTEYIGWDSWSKRILKTAFMAPIFMFFMYLIFKIVNTSIWEDIAMRSPKDQGMIETMLFLFLPALIILILLIKATKFAKEASGALGEMLISGAKIAGGLAIGGGMGLAAKGLQGSLGHIGKRVFESKTLAEMETDKKSRLNRFIGTGLRSIAGGDDGKGGWAGSSFDVRKGAVGGILGAVGSAAGVKLDSNIVSVEAGGYEADLKKRDAKRKARAEGLKTKEGEKEKQDLNDAKEGHQTVSLNNEKDIHEKDRDIIATEGKVKYLKDVADSAKNLGQNDDGTYKDPQYQEKQEAYSEMANKLKQLKDERSAIKGGAFNEKTGKYRTHNGNITEEEVKKARRAEVAAGEAEVAAGEAYTDAVNEKSAAEATALAAAKAAKNASAAAYMAPQNTALASAAEAALAAAKAADEAVVKATTKATKTKETVTNVMATYDQAKTRTAEVNIAAMAAKANGGFGNSQNKYEDEILPEKEHQLKYVNDTRIRAYADNTYKENSTWDKMQFWNRAARKKSAHEMRMGVKAESGGKGEGHGVGLAGHAGIEWLGQALSSHGHDKSSPPASPAKESGGSAPEHKT